jgi:hypothetical protein
MLIHLLRLEMKPKAFKMDGEDLILDLRLFRIMLKLLPEPRQYSGMDLKESLKLSPSPRDL